MSELDWVVVGVLATFAVLMAGLVVFWRTSSVKKLDLHNRIRQRVADVQTEIEELATIHEAADDSTEAWATDGQHIAELAERVHAARYENLKLKQLEQVLGELDRITERIDALTKKYKQTDIN